MGGDEAMDKFEICMGANLTCMNDLMNRMGEFDHVDYQGKQTKCRSACEDQVGSQTQIMLQGREVIKTKTGQLSVRHHLLLPKQKDSHLQRGVLHRHQPPHQEMQEL